MKGFVRRSPTAAAVVVNNTGSISRTSAPSSLWLLSSSSLGQSNYLLTSLRYKSGIKTNSGAKKRFRVRGSGSIKRYEPKFKKFRNCCVYSFGRCFLLSNLSGDVAFTLFDTFASDYILSFFLPTCRGKSGASHNTGFKTRQRVNRLGSSTGIEGKKMEQRVRKLLGAYN
jgi:ribosomal protein L35